MDNNFIKYKRPLIVVAGPTNSGKSDFSMVIAQRFGGELVCADSRTIYKGLDIGTAKPTPEMRRKVPHHMLDTVEPDQRFTAADFKRMADQAIHDITDRGKLPILVGGTGLYVDAVIFNYSFGPQANLTERNTLNRLTVQELQRICEQRGGDLPHNIHNKRHLVRAIETGGILAQPKELRPYTKVVGITSSKDDLYQRAVIRAGEMLREGVLNEACKASAHYGWGIEAMSGNIYGKLKDFADGKLSKEELVEQVARKDMALAKRQMTWFKRNPYITWGAQEELLSEIAEFIDVVKS